MIAAVTHGNARKFLEYYFLFLKLFMCQLFRVVITQEVDLPKVDSTAATMESFVT